MFDYLIVEQKYLLRRQIILSIKFNNYKCTFFLLVFLLKNTSNSIKHGIFVAKLPIMV